MTNPNIYADFQNLDDFNRLRLICAGTRKDLTQQGIQLQEGLVLTLYMDDADDQGQPNALRAEGVVTFNEDEHCWVAAIDWSALRHASQEKNLDVNGSNLVPLLPSNARLEEQSPGLRATDSKSSH